ncbi:DUF488 domain-containing protein [Muricauda ruestringensis]|uniref:DUF488 domain-containing protein n=1 Tax=Flagellimonas ruestringensis TaxID=111501 RepID=UPI001CD61782|nr:DUF488 domain-containing protein [Allomuricauda ruestringensis]MCA0959565.1 DUF488 domain-containing protein [Allomuricauda ruestringensis]
MQDSTIYSIGHGNKSFEEFLVELKEHQIDYVFDVRSSPISKYNFHFNRSWLEVDLPNNSVVYEFLGEYLGGLPKNRKYYTNGKVDYSKLSASDFFIEGIKLLIEANNESLRIALMCSETKPEECHRSKLIGRELLKHNISINHITSDGIKSQEEIIEKLTKGFGAQDLFGEKDFTSRNTYL